MDKITVGMFTNNKSSIDHDDGEINVTTLSNRVREYDVTYNIDSLLKTRRLRRDEKAKLYNRFYSKCFEEIKTLNEQNISESIYELPAKNDEIHNYNAEECCDVLVTKITEKYMDIYRINYRTIYISWDKIEYNMERKSTLAEHP